VTPFSPIVTTSGMHTAQADPLRRSFPKMTGLPCSSCTIRSVRTRRATKSSKAPSLKMLQFW